MPLIETPALWLPSYGQGFARCQAEAANPGLREGLVFNWHGPLGVTGATAFDTSGRKNNGTLTNMDPASDWVMTEKGWALDFGIAGRRVEVPNVLPTGDYSIAAWIYVDSLLATYNCIADNSIGAGSGFRFYINTTKLKLQNEYTYGSAGATDPDALPLNEWVLVVGTSHNTGATATVKVYVNGKLKATAAAADDYVRNGSAISIGDHSGASGSSISVLDGRINQVSFWTRVLTFSEIQLLFRDQHAIVRPMMRVPVGQSARYWMWARQQQAQVIGGGVL